MTPLADSPFLTLVLSFLILWACAWIGAKVLGKYAAGGQFLVLPLVMAIAFFLIADIDSPAGGGVMHVTPQNLLALGKLIR